MRGKAGLLSRRSLPWVISQAVFSESVGIQDGLTVMRGLRVSSDGSRLFSVFGNKQRIYQHSLSVPHDLATISLDATLLVIDSGNVSMDMHISDDGSHMLVVYFDSSGANDEVAAYSLSTPYSLSSAALVHVFNVSAKLNEARCIFSSADGLQMFVGGALATGSNGISTYDLATPFDLETASHSQDSTLSEYPDALAFGADGSVMFTLDNTNDVIKKYSLSTPWDTSTKSSDSSFSLPSGAWRGIAFSADGLLMYPLTEGGTINKYSLV